MSYFNEWWKTESLNTFDYPKEAAESGFEAGAASRQAEIDELRKEANKEREQATEYFTDFEFANAKCRELQKRIELALRLIKNKDCLNYLDKVETILKGENND